MQSLQKAAAHQGKISANEPSGFNGVNANVMNHNPLSGISFGGSYVKPF